MKDFKESITKEQIAWRIANLDNQKQGKQNAGYYDHVLPSQDWQLNLWPEIAGDSGDSLPSYLKSERIRKHAGTHNLLSSWILCANLYYPFRDESRRQYLLDFLQNKISTDIESVDKVELEHAFEERSLNPSEILGETDGSRGAGQTSPDIAFEVTTEDGPGIILVECKFTEHSFYTCSGRKKKTGGRPPNLDKERCKDILSVLDNPDQNCHLNSWGRKYWNHLAGTMDRSLASSLKSCPAAYGGYQLFRQQALAEGLFNTGKFPFVVSVVAYDERNESLMHCLAKSTGLQDIRTDWGPLFAGKTTFATFTHQEWVEWISKTVSDEYVQRWLAYVKERYQL